MARPTKLTPEAQSKICQAVRTGATREIAALAAGVSERTLYYWIERGQRATERLRQKGARRRKREEPFLQFYHMIIETEARLRDEKSAQAVSELPNHRSRRRACFVYLIEAENGLVKIGKTVDLPRRFRDLITMSPVKLELIAFVETELADELESRLHNEFDDRRVKGEWFSLTPENIRMVIQQYGFDEQTEGIC